MSSYTDASWLRRLWSLAAPGAPETAHVQNVNLVNDSRYRGSRERAPYAYWTGLLDAPGATNHVFVEITGIDRLGVAPEKLLHRVHMQTPSGGAWAVVNVDGAALTTVSRTAVTPVLMDNDPDLTPQLFTGVITAASLPTLNVLPIWNTLMSTAATPTVANQTAEMVPLGGLPFAAAWRENSLMFINTTANLLSVVQVAWQIFRA